MIRPGAGTGLAPGNPHHIGARFQGNAPWRVQFQRHLLHHLREQGTTGQPAQVVS